MAIVSATVGPAADSGVLGTQPAHVRVEQYVPQTALLPHCDVVVSHAGSGTVLGTVALGVPQLCLPQGADQFLNASAVAGAGAGISLAPDAATPEAIADAVARGLGASGVLVVVTAEHDCVALRGRRLAGTSVVTLAARGDYEDGQGRAEALALAGGPTG